MCYDPFMADKLIFMSKVLITLSMHGAAQILLSRSMIYDMHISSSTKVKIIWQHIKKYLNSAYLVDPC